MNIRLVLTTCSIALILISGLCAESPVQNIHDLKNLQAKIHKVVKKVQPATVSVFSPENGASGSAVIVNSSGLILTAGHVVRGAEEMTVIFADGAQTKAKVLGANYTRDTAMLQITEPGPWPFARLGHSRNLNTGDLVIALGHAGGYDPVRSAPVRFGRIISTSNDGFFNTDCALIGGDSGGPLFDLDGRVIGIHSSIGYSIKINNHTGIDGFREDWTKLKSGETWGQLGGKSQLGGRTMDNPNNPVIGILTALGENGGIAIQHIIKGGPAFKAGLLRGDIIRSINGKYIRNPRRLYAIIFQFKPGDTVNIQVIRDNKILTRRLTLGRRGDFAP